MKKVIALIGTLSVVSSAIAFAPSNDPKYFGERLEYRFNNLPTSGELSSDATPWSSTYWPHNYSGIAIRWQKLNESDNLMKNYVTALKNSYNDFYDVDDKIKELKGEIASGELSESQIINTTNHILRLKNDKVGLHHKRTKIRQDAFFNVYRPNSKSDVKAMSQEQINRLSSAEKFDIYMGNYNFKLTNNVLKYAKAKSSDWEGICNGWTTAAIEFHEPKVITKRNKDGIKVTFYSSDLKGLLSHYHSMITRTANKTTNKWYVGKKCNDHIPEEAWIPGVNGKEFFLKKIGNKMVKTAVPPECKGIDAGAFHVILANYIGIRNQSFAAEVVRDIELWNQPISKFESTVVKRTGNRVHMKAKMYYADDGGLEFWKDHEEGEEYYAWKNPTNGTNNYKQEHREYEYYVDLDRKGKITGGEWISYERPDFFWIKKSKGFVTRGAFAGTVKYMSKGLKNLVRIR